MPGRYQVLQAAKQYVKENPEEIERILEGRKTGDARYLVSIFMIDFCGYDYFIEFSYDREYDQSWIGTARAWCRI